MCIAVCLSLASTTSSLEIIQTNENLNEFPSDIPTDVTHLDLSVNQIVGDTFSILTSLELLEHLDLSTNLFTEVPNISACVNLEYFSMKSNKLLTVIPQDTFISNINLHLLHLDFCSGLDGTFLLLIIPESLTVLTAQNTYVIQVDLEDVKPDSNTQLMTLKLGYNKLKMMPSFSDAIFRSLQVLSLDKNEDISQIDVNYLRKLENITEISLTGLSCNMFPNITLGLPRNLITLKLGFREIDTTWDDIAVEMKYFSTLEFFAISYADMVTFPNISYWQSTLKEIEFYRDLITDPPEDVFNYVSLSRINLQFNQLTRIPNVQPQRNTLERLLLSYNDIRVITSDKLSGMNRLNNLSLDNNKITQIADISFLFPIIQRMNLAGNPFNCDGSLTWMINPDLKGMLLSVYPCATPDHLTTRPWNEITSDDLLSGGMFK